MTFQPRRRMTVAGGLAAAACMALGAPSTVAAQARNVRYIDVHSHLFKAMPAEEEVAAFRRAGVAGVILMWPDPVPLAEAGRKNPGYVLPWLSLSALNGSVTSPSTGAEFIAARDKLGFCGFGELATRLAPPNPQVSDAAFVSDPNRVKIYDAAEARGTPVNMHVSLVEAETRTAVEQIVASHPHAPFIIAHGGGGIGPDVIAQLLAAHPNLHFDLSGPMSPPRPGAERPTAALAADGALRPEWRALFERYPDRFMWAMDVQSVDSVAGIPQKLAAARTAFAALPLATEEAIAHGNIERVLGGCGGLTAR